MVKECSITFFPVLIAYGTFYCISTHTIFQYIMYPLIYITCLVGYNLLLIEWKIIILHFSSTHPLEMSNTLKLSTYYMTHFNDSSAYREEVLRRILYAQFCLWKLLQSLPCGNIHLMFMNIYKMFTIKGYVQLHILHSYQNYMTLYIHKII